MKILSPLPYIPVRECAFFFDVDGTLAEIKPRPEDVSVPSDTRQALAMLVEQTQGAVALVSGRPIEELDTLISPLTLPLAGIHGAERRDVKGELQRISLPEKVSTVIAETLSAALVNMPGTLLENKGSAFALHYRQVPHYDDAIQALAQQVVDAYPELVLQPGKCVVELKPRGVNKGAAIAAFMQSSPFAGRRPIFFGDDVTDEAGFVEVNQQGGLSVKIGDGETIAPYRLQSVQALAAWLQQTLLQEKITSVRREGDESFSGRI